VKDDPTLSVYEETPLNGHYEFDDEGVPSKPVVLIEKGVLRNYLMSRKPIEGATSSNGHGRSRGVASPVGRMGNLLVEAEGAVTLEELKKQLIKEVRAAGKPFGLIVGDVTGGSTNTMNYGYQAFKGGASQVFKMDVETGAMELVRGVEIVGTPLSSINKVVAASEESGVFNGYCGAESGYVPVGTISPALLLREIELQRSMRSRQKGPILPAPKGLRGEPNSP
jgi:predicted Zn-dependent protease